MVSVDRLLSLHVATGLAHMIKDDSLELLQVVMSSAPSLLLRAGCLIKRWFVLLLILIVCVLSPNHLI